MSEVLTQNQCQLLVKEYFNMIPSTEGINQVIRNNKDKIDTNLISDGYHTIGELYDHRALLWITVCRKCSHETLTMHPRDQQDRTSGNRTWRSEVHSDGSKFEGWFLLGITHWRYNSKYQIEEQQLTYHLPMKYWDQCSFVDETLDKAPEFDGHTSADVLERLMKL